MFEGKDVRRLRENTIEVEIFVGFRLDNNAIYRYTSDNDISHCIVRGVTVEVFTY